MKQGELTKKLQDVAEQFGVAQWRKHQKEALKLWADLSAPKRMAIVYPTGAGKTITALACLALNDITEALVIAPKSTVESWTRAAEKGGLKITVITPEKFRREDFKLPRPIPIIYDEFHQTGSYTGKGFKKLLKVARLSDQPLIIQSATPTYNDAIRAFCVEAILTATRKIQPRFLVWLSHNCITEPSLYSRTPNFVKFRQHDSVTDYLTSLHNVTFLPDTAEYTIEDIHLPELKLPRYVQELNMDPLEERVYASIIERNQRLEYLSRVDWDTRKIRPEITKILLDLLKENRKLVVYSRSKKIAYLVQEAMIDAQVKSEIYTGDLVSLKSRSETLNRFLTDPEVRVMVSTDSLATGTDGLDQVCDTLVLVTDTPDASKRRQLIGRILDRTGNLLADSEKRFIRIGAPIV